MRTRLFTKLWEHASIDEMWLVLIRQLLAEGVPLESRAGPVRELMSYSATLSDPSRSFLRNPARRLDPSYAAAETLWYLSGSDRTEMLEAYAPSYAQFSTDGAAYGAYGPRVMPQVEELVRKLRESPNTRQAVIVLWRPEDLSAITPDVPCTVALQYQRRDSLLWATTFMRSNDAWLGFPYDVFAFTCMQRLIADMCDLRPGPYTHMVGNMHLYARNVDRARDAVKSERCTLQNDWGLPLVVSSQSALETVRTAVREEAELRSGVPIDGVESLTSDVWPMLGDLVRSAVGKFRPMPAPRSAALREALNDRHR